MLTIDLNCDMGEGLETDAEIFPFISSANIACGGHAGDAGTMRRTVALALQHGVAIGGHPSYPDRDGFGRTDRLESSPGKGDRPLRLDDLADMLTDQLRQLRKIVDEMGGRLHHVKPHGALYNRAAKDAVVSELICQTIKSFDPSLLLYGLSGSEMRRQAEACGLGFVSEVFADRTYQRDGSLTPRTEPHALIHDDETMIRQVLLMIREGKVRATDGADVSIAADTLCLHGDGAHAVEFAARIRRKLDEQAIFVKI